MKYIWLKTMTEENRLAIDGLRAECLIRDGRLPLLNLPEQMEACDGCLAAVAEDSEIRGLLTCLYGENTVEVCLLVHPDDRKKGIGTELLHRLILSTKKIPVFPVLPDDGKAMEFLNCIGRQEAWRERLMTLTRESYTDEDPGVSPGQKKRLRVTCETCSVPEDDGNAAPVTQMRYTLYDGILPVGRCLVTRGCVSEFRIRSIFRKRGCGSFLLRTVIRHQFRLGRRKLFLHVTSFNRAARALYLKYGFDVAEEVIYYS